MSHFVDIMEERWFCVLLETILAESEEDKNYRTSGQRKRRYEYEVLCKIEIIWIFQQVMEEKGDSVSD